MDNENNKNVLDRKNTEDLKGRKANKKNITKTTGANHQLIN